MVHYKTKLIQWRGTHSNKLLLLKPAVPYTGTKNEMATTNGTNQVRYIFPIFNCNTISECLKKVSLASQFNTQVTKDGGSPRDLTSSFSRILILLHAIFHRHVLLLSHS